MAYITPKVDWLATDGVANGDMNRIEGNIVDLNSRVALIRTTLSYTIATTDWGSESGGVVSPLCSFPGIVVGDKPEWSMISATAHPTATEKANEKLLDSISVTADNVQFHASSAPTAAVVLEVRL